MSSAEGAGDEHTGDEHTDDEHRQGNVPSRITFDTVQTVTVAAMDRGAERDGVPGDAASFNMALCEMASVDAMCINAETSAESIADTEIQPPTASGMNAIEVRITWNASLPVPSDEQEELLIH